MQEYMAEEELWKKKKRMKNNPQNNWIERGDTFNQWIDIHYISKKLLKNQLKRKR